MKNLYGYGNYAAILAHPDDEMYTVNVIKSLIEQGKKVDLIYLTSGDYQGAEVGLAREQELATAMDLLELPAANVHLLRFPEKELSHQLRKAKDTVENTLRALNPDCVLTHDFEGGHNMHDLVSYCGYSGARKIDADLWTFPAYHNHPKSRLWNQFANEKEPDFSLTLDEKQIDFKYQIFAAHASQKSFFELVLASSSKKYLMQREILRFVDQELDYTSAPTTPVGYDFEGSPVNFEGFRQAISQSEK